MKEHSIELSFEFTHGEKPKLSSLLRALIYCDQSHRFLGGSGLRLDRVALKEAKKVPDSDYDIFANTPFENNKIVYIEDICGAPDYSTQEVYDAIRQYATSCRNRFAIYRDVRRTYPRKDWEGRLPCESINLILAHHDKLKDLLTEEDKRTLREKYQQAKE